MSCEPDRNPSPPPEVLSSCADLVPDKIGETVFSKHWLFKTLMNVIQTVEKEEQKLIHKECLPHISQNLSDENKPTGDSQLPPDILELDTDLEEEVCNLWDMSANSDVAHFLYDFKAVEIFLEVIDKTKSPRLVEIAVGILGNMASFNDLCQIMSTESKLVKTILLLMGSSDAPTLVQVVRMVHTCIVNDVAEPCWIQELKENTCIVDSIHHILGNSLNGELLKGTLHLIYYVLNRNDELCVNWGSSNFLEALCNSATQLHSLGDYNGLDEVWHVIHLLCQHEEVLSLLVKLFPSLHPVLCDYMTKFEENDVLLPPPDRIPAVSAAVSVTSALLMTHSQLIEELENDSHFLSCLQKMLHSVNEKLQKEPSSTCTKNYEEKTPINSCANSSIISNLNSYSVSEDNCTETQSSAVDTVVANEDSHTALLVLQDLLTDFCNLIIPSLNQDSDVRRALMQVLETSTKSHGASPVCSDRQNKHESVS